MNLQGPQCHLPLPWHMYSRRAQTSPRVVVAVFRSTWLLTAQVKLVLSCSRGRLTARGQALEPGPRVPLCCHCLGTSLCHQVTFRNSVAPSALHSRVTLHQSAVTDSDVACIWGRGTGSAGRYGGEGRLRWGALHSAVLTQSHERWRPPAYEGESIFQVKQNWPKHTASAHKGGPVG